MEPDTMEFGTSYKRVNTATSMKKNHHDKGGGRPNSSEYHLQKGQKGEGH